MKGKLSVRVKNRHIEFRLELERNVTILTGDSGTGKTKLIQMVQSYAQLGKASGVTLTCKRPCMVLAGRNWESELAHTSQSVVFVDEGAPFLTSHAFASLMQQTDNYYVLVTREKLPQVPYSIDAIKQIIKNDAKPKVEKVYRNLSAKTVNDFRYDVVIVEDSRAGLQFFEKATEGLPAACVTAGGKSGILPLLRKYRGKRVLVVADAAALGPEIRDLQYYSQRTDDVIHFFLPESFEWLVLRSGVFAADASVQEVLRSPADHIESGEYFSWERFFTAFLTEKSKGKPALAYSKSRLASGYCTEANIRDILNGMNKK